MIAQFASGISILDPDDPYALSRKQVSPKRGSRIIGSGDGHTTAV